MKIWYQVNWNKINIKELEKMTGVSYSAIASVYYKNRKISDTTKLYQALTKEQRDEFLIPITSNGDNIVFYNKQVEELKVFIEEEFNDLLEIASEFNAKDEYNRVKYLKENIDTKYNMLLMYYIKDDEIITYLTNYFDNIINCIERTWNKMGYQDEDEPTTKNELDLLIVYLEAEIFKMHDMFFVNTPKKNVKG